MRNEITPDLIERLRSDLRVDRLFIDLEHHRVDTYRVLAVRGEYHVCNLYDAEAFWREIDMPHFYEMFRRAFERGTRDTPERVPEPKREKTFEEKMADWTRASQRENE